MHEQSTITEQYSGDEPIHETNRKSHSHSHSDGAPVSDINRKLPYDETAPRPLNWVNSYIGNSSNYLSMTTLL